MMIRRVGLLSLVKALGILYALLVLIVRPLVAMVSLLGAAGGAANSQPFDAFARLLFDVGSVIFLPIFYGLLGFGLIGALLYNGIARLIRGIEIELEKTSTRTPATIQKRRSGPS
jgi:hypothetical protein